MAVKVLLVGGPHPGAEVSGPGRRVVCLCHKSDGSYEFRSITRDGPPHVATYVWRQAPERMVQQEIQWEWTPWR